MPQEQAENFLINPPGRLVYTDSLIAPKAFRSKDGAGGLPRYNCQVLIAETNPVIPQLQALILKIAAEKFAPRDVRTLKLPLKSGISLNGERVTQGKQPLDFYPGNFVLFAQKPEKSRAGALLTPPGLKVLQGGKPVDYSNRRDLAKSFFYNGVLAAVSVQFKDFSGFGGGITCYLDRVLSMNSGDLINVGRSDEDVFGSADSYAEYVGTISAESVLGGTVVQGPW